jgi:hypothetical protein
MFLKRKFKKACPKNRIYDKPIHYQLIIELLFLFYSNLLYNRNYTRNVKHFRNIKYCLLDKFNRV